MTSIQSNTTVYDYNLTIISDEYNISGNESKPSPTGSHNTVKNVVIICFYTFIVIISLCGNLLVCKIAFTKKKMRTTTNLLIASLATSDIVMTAFNIPFNIARLLLPFWPFGSFLCVFIQLTQTSCVYVSTFTMAVIALHRWRTITKRSSFRTFSPLKLFALIVTIWLMAVIFSLPVAIFNELTSVTMNGVKVIRCRPRYPKFINNFSLFLSLEILVTQYIIPLTVTCFVYSKIGFIVYRQGKLAGQSNDERKRRQIEAKRRRIIMLVLVVIVFGICCYNPFIYFYYNPCYRAMVKESLGCIFRCLKYYKVQTDNTGETCADVDDENTIRNCTNYTVCQTERIEMIDKNKFNTK